MATIAVGGFQHETNTFAPLKATYKDFEEADGWPRLVRGPEMFPELDGVHLPITGALAVFEAAGHDIYPLSWSSASPSAHVTEDAFERLTGYLLEDIEIAMKRPGGLDGIYLDLHGAMVCEHTEDGEGELLRRVRDLVGPDMPISVSLDLHANVTDLMVEKATVMDIFRTYPHIDMGETGARSARQLCHLIATNERWAKAHIKTNFLIPLVFGCTYFPSPKKLYEDILPELLESNPALAALSFACGFDLADIYECGPSIIAYGEDQETADQAAKALYDALEELREGFGGKVYQPDDVVQEAMQISQSASKPVIIADTQDNSGGGGPGDTTGMLRALVRNQAKGAVIGVFNDPVTADKAHEIGVGNSFKADIGGKKQPEDNPYQTEAKVIALGDGVFKGTGPMWGGANFELGNMALLEVEHGIKVAIMSKPMQLGDTSMLRHLGMEPENEKIIVVKSSVHFRADFEPLAEAVLVAASDPGPVYANVVNLTFNNLREGVKRVP